VHNLLVIAVDTLRPDHLGCYGYERATSPAIDRLAASADRFISCWSASNFTAPAFTSLFTGLYPNHHRVFDFRAKVHGSAVFDVLKAANVKTGGVVTFRFFQHLLGDIWGPLEAVTDTRSGDYAKDLPQAVTDGAVEWLHARDPARPFALFVHYDGPHMPYRLPARHAGRFGDVETEGVDPELAEIFYPRQDDLGEQASGEVLVVAESGHTSTERLELEEVIASEECAIGQATLPAHTGGVHRNDIH